MGETQAPRLPAARARGSLRAIETMRGGAGSAAMNDKADLQKRRAAARSLDYVEAGMTLGLGTGSTAAHMVRLLGERVRAGLDVRGVPTSRATEALASEMGIPLLTLEDVTRLDLAIDGADEIDGDFQLIKGGGGALLREKVVASVSDRLVIIADRSKMVRGLGAFPLPVEVVRFAWKVVAEAIEDDGVTATLRMVDGAPFVTDEGHCILDCAHGRIEDAHALAARLGAIPGVVEHGLFLDMADVAILAGEGDAEVIERG